MTGSHNINSADSEDSNLKFRECLDEKDKTKKIFRFCDYIPLHPNVVQHNKLIRAGETQVYGLSVSPGNKSFVMIKDDASIYSDYLLLREGKHGYYGWEDVGFMFADTTTACMGVIDRSL